ncbi:MAG: YihY/virulence factor BrkB family protein [Thiovulaceae bacterium]|nr:YihY/virulence factor BrkB family protein [Sulfurimonadaceae bacterium]
MKSINRNHCYRHARFFIKELFDDELTYYASSLSFYTISTIVPLLVIIFSILPRLANFDEYYATLKVFLIENLLPVQTEVVTDYLDTFIANSAQLGILGLSTTLVISLLFFISFSYVINTIFKARHSGFFKTIITYLFLVILLPMGLVLSFYFTSSVSKFINTHLFESTFQVSTAFSYLIEWTLFFIIYKIAPNVYVYYKAAAISALIATLIWSSSKAAFVYYVLLAKATSTIYGPFAITIFFLTWIYLSWIIFVYGLRLCYLINRSYGYSRSHKK